MNQSDWFWASQLASGTVLWNQYTQASAVVKDFHTLLPLSVAMRADATPWMDWLGQHPHIVQSMETQFYKPISELMAAAMLSWTEEWESRVEHGDMQLRMFLQEWQHVLTTPGLARYRESRAGGFQLKRLGERILTCDSSHIQRSRGDWVCTTLRLAPQAKCGELAYQAWSQMPQPEREKLQPQWAQWHALFPDREAFLAMALHGHILQNPAQALDLPADLDV